MACSVEDRLGLTVAAMRLSGLTDGIAATDAVEVISREWVEQQGVGEGRG